jgi:hypothetical protein
MAAFSRGKPLGLRFSSQFSISIRSRPSRAPLLSGIAIEQSRYFTQSPSHLNVPRKKPQTVYNDFMLRRERQQSLIDEASKKREAARAARSEVEKTRYGSIGSASNTETSAVEESEISTSPAQVGTFSTQNNTSSGISTTQKSSTQLHKISSSPKSIPVHGYRADYARNRERDFSASLPSAKTLIASGKEKEIYKQPPSRTLTIASFIVTFAFGFMLYNMVVWVWTLNELGLRDQWWMSLTYFLTGSVMGFLAWAGYSVRSRLVKRITLMPKQIGNKQMLYARIEGRGWLPFQKIKDEVPFTSLSVNKLWTDLEQPKIQPLPGRGTIHWSLRWLYRIRQELRAWFFELRFKLSRQLMIRLWTDERSQNSWNSWLVDAHGLVSRNEGRPLNDADGKFSTPYRAILAWTNCSCSFLQVHQS